MDGRADAARALVGATAGADITPAGTPSFDYFNISYGWRSWLEHKELDDHTRPGILRRAISRDGRSRAPTFKRPNPARLSQPEKNWVGLLMTSQPAPTSILYAQGYHTANLTG